MKRFDDDTRNEATRSSSRTLAHRGNDEADLVRRAGSGDQQAFDLLYDRYFARMSWYFTILGQRKAKAAVAEVMTDLFGSLDAASEISFAERAYRLAIATALRDSDPPKKVGPGTSRHATVQSAASRPSILP